MGRGKSTPLIKNGIDHRRKKNCSICKAIYFKKVLINEKQWLESIYCSRECKRQWQIGRPHPVTNRRKMTESEKLYGRSIGRWSGWNKGFKHSEETKRKISAGHQGITVKEWSGYIVKKDRLERHRFRNEIQKKVFERDNYVCQICFVRGGLLQVDHIQSWSEYIELRFNMNNCRTLCMNCHYKITFGREKPEDVTAWGHNLFRKVG